MARPAEHGELPRPQMANLPSSAGLPAGPNHTDTPRLAKPAAYRGSVRRSCRM